MTMSTNHRFHLAGMRPPSILTLLPLVLVLVIGSPVAQARTQPALPSEERDPTSVAYQIHDGILTQGDLAAAVWLFSSEAAIHTPEGVFHGANGFRGFAHHLRTAFPNVAFTAGDVTTQGDIVTIRWTMTGQHRGAYQSVPASYTTVAIDGITMLRFSGDLVTEGWVVYDRLAVLEQIGTAHRTVP